MASDKDDRRPVTNNALGRRISMENEALTTGARMTQDFEPLTNVCAHLNAFHAYADDTSGCVETNHYCSLLNNDIRQCLLYDSPSPRARLIGIEYMISPALYETLNKEERCLWHSHVYEVKSGMLVMPNTTIPNPVWEVAENREMNEVVTLYGKAFHLWQTDRGDHLPLGPPRLMTSFTNDGQLDFESSVGERDKKFGVDWKRKKEIRKHIGAPEVHEDADQAWKI